MRVAYKAENSRCARRHPFCDGLPILRRYGEISPILAGGLVLCSIVYAR